MSILFDKIIHEYDENPKFAEWDRAQPLSVAFVTLGRWLDM